jgi:hypothetical protein
MFEDAIFNTTSGSFVDTGVAITPDNGVNLVFARASSGAGPQGSDSGSLQVTYDGDDVGISEPVMNGTGGHWNSNDIGMIKLVTGDGVKELKLQAHPGSAGSRSIDVGAQQLLSIPLETMGLVEGVDYFRGEFFEGTGPGDPFQWEFGEDWQGNLNQKTAVIEIARVDFTASETEVYLFFYSFESSLVIPVNDGTYALYPVATSTDRIRSCSITSSGTVATVTLVNHGYQNNFQTKIVGANQSEYNGVFVINKVTDDTFKYTIVPTSSPATGTITEQREPVSESSQVSHVVTEGSSVGWFESKCWVYARGITAGPATVALVGRHWTSNSEVNVRRVRLIAIKASSLTAGWGVGEGSTQKTAFFSGNQWDPRVSEDGNGATFAEITNYTQTYVPVGPGTEQTIFFWMAVNTAAGSDIFPPSAITTFKIRNVTDAKDFCIDMAKPMQQTDNINWTFGMAVRDNNTSSSTWQIQARDANNLNTQTRHRNGVFMVVGLKNNF